VRACSLNLNVASDLDRLLARLHANKAELLKVLDSTLVAFTPA
jgi:hypothetical protein